MQLQTGTLEDAQPPPGADLVTDVSRMALIRAAPNPAGFPATTARTEWRIYCTAGTTEVKPRKRVTASPHDETNGASVEAGDTSPQADAAGHTRPR